MFENYFNKQNLKIIESGDEEKISKLIKKRGNNFSEEAQLALLKKGICIDLFIKHSSNLCAEALKLIVERGVTKDICYVIQHNDIPEETEKLIIARGIDSEQEALVRKGLQCQSSVSEIIAGKNHKAIMALLEEISSFFSTLRISEEDKNKIIFNDNQEEIKTFFKRSFLPSEEAILHLIDVGNVEAVITAFSINCQHYNPFSDKIIKMVLDKGDEQMIFAMLRQREKLLLHLKQVHKSLDWLEKAILARGNKDEISMLARIYPISDQTIYEILKRDNKQEIKAIIDNERLDDKFVYNLIENRKYDLLENYAKYASDKYLYMFSCLMKKHS